MAIPSSLTVNYNALFASTMFKYAATMADNIGKDDKFLFMLMKRNGGKGYQVVPALTERMALPIMYELNTMLPYNGYDGISVAPMDGITTAFWDWRQASTPISISGREKALNKGEGGRFNLLDAKVQQAEMGMKEGFAKGLLQGNGGAAITTPLTNPGNAALFFEPIPSIIRYDPTTSTVIGNINQQTHAWWRNKTLADASTTFKGFLKAIDNLYYQTALGPGGPPDWHICDLNVFELYGAALREYHHNPDYTKADIPFDALAFHGQPLVYSEFVPDIAGGSATQSTTSGTWFMINSKFWKMIVDASLNFATTPFVSGLPTQDSDVAQILLMGGLGCNNRRKQGVAGSLDTTIVT